MKFLLVDDDHDIIEILEEEIKNNLPDVETIFANSAQSAIQILQLRNDIDLIISDYNMPNGTGFDLLAYIMNKNLSTRFIFFTSLTTPELPLNVNEKYLGNVEKFDFSKLIDRVSEYLKSLDNFKRSAS